MSDDFDFSFTPPNFINAMIDIRNEKGDSFGRLLLMTCDVNEELIARYGRHGYFNAHGAPGTDGHVLRYMANKFNIYKSEFVGSLGFMPGIDADIWAETREGFAVTHLKNHDMVTIPLNTILSFIKNPADEEPEVDRALRRVFMNILESQLPLLAAAFDIGTDTVTLDRTEQTFLRLMITFRAFQLAEDLGVKKVNGEPINILLKNMQDSMTSFFQKNDIPPEQLNGIFEKITRLLPGWDPPEDVNDEKSDGAKEDTP